MAKRIVVLQRGWVVVGDVTQDAEQLKVENASVIRRWGTKAGLGELAAKGPQPNTVLDAAGTVLVHPLAVVLQLDVDSSKWPA